MVFKKVSESKGNSTPFFDVWIKEQTEEFKEFLHEKLMESKHIKEVSSGKGYMLNFDDEFLVFVWKNSSEGRIIKRMIKEEQGFLLLLQFQKGKKDLEYSIGFDEEVECCVTEDKFDEGIYYYEATTPITPIAPDENRNLLMQIPMLSPKRAAPPSIKTKKKQPPSGAMGEPV